MEGVSSFSINTMNVGHSPYMFMWNNSCGLNTKGKLFMVGLGAKMKLMGDKGREYGAQVVKDMVKDDSYLQYSSSPKRESDIASFLASHTANVLAMQEVSNLISLPAILNGTKLVNGQTSMFNLTLNPSDELLEKRLERGNSAHAASNMMLLSSGQVSYEKTGKPPKGPSGGKQQTRFVPWIITQSAAVAPMIFSASIHLSGYWSGAVTAVKPEVVEQFRKDYALVQQELVHYIQSTIKEAEEHKADAIVLAGDWNQCGNTHDHVTSIGLETHSNVLANFGFIEDTNSSYTTTFDGKYPRRLDRVFVRMTPNSDWKFMSMKTNVLGEGKNLDSLSDHAPVQSLIQFKK